MAELPAHERHRGPSIGQVAGCRAERPVIAPIHQRDTSNRVIAHHGNLLLRPRGGRDPCHQTAFFHALRLTRYPAARVRTSCQRPSRWSATPRLFHAVQLFGVGSIALRAADSARIVLPWTIGYRPATRRVRSRRVLATAVGRCPILLTTLLTPHTQNAGRELHGRRDHSTVVPRPVGRQLVDRAYLRE